ncbi:MAG: response regulator [Planctomycetota bacterium]
MPSLTSTQMLSTNPAQRNAVQARVLIVDDNAASRQLLRAVLETEGHTLFEAGDGVEALSVLGRQKIDVVISEILMPEMDGYGLCYELRKDSRFKAIPLIIYSSTYVSASDKNLALNLGVSAFLPKPASLSALCEALLAALTGKAPIRARMESPEELEALREYSQRLIRTIEEDRVELTRRTEELHKAEAQLRQSQKMEAIGRLAGGVAHDFNNLLTVIMGRTELTMIRVKSDERLWHELELVYKTGARAAALTRQLLAFSRQQVLQPVMLDLNEVVAGIEDMLRRMLGEDISLVTVLEPGLGTVKADPSQLEQVLMNLAVNARDAMPGCGKLTIETATIRLDESYCRSHANAKPGCYVLLAVTDTGCGMDAETQSRIFEPFFTTKEQGKGTGLGLSTVYGIVKQSGGNIEVYSEVGKGTTFKIYLPLAEGVVQPVRPSATLPAVRGGQETILVVEDEDPVRELVREMLEPNGYTVLLAPSGRAALRACAEHTGRVHLLLTDVVMPEMSGVQLAQDLGKTQTNLKVLFMSGYATHAIMNNSILERGAEFIQKPFTPGKLARKVREVLDEA